VTVAEQVRQFICKNFYVPDPAGLSDTASFLDLGIVDSTGVLEVVAFVEQEFGVTVDDTEIVPENFDSIASLVGYVERKRGTSG
jgi:acyl carrier protein